MPNIVIASYPLAEHYSAAFQIAKQLKERGYNLVFIDISDVFENEIVSRGFEFEVISGDPSLSPHLMDKDNNVFVQILRLFRSVKDKNVSFYVDAYDALVEKFKPVVIILDCRLIENAVLLRRYKVPTLVFQTLICPNKLPGIPPPNSRHIPGKSMLSYLITECLWLRFFCFKICNRILDTMHDRNQGLVRYAVMKRLADMINYPLKDNVERARFLNIGLKNIPEFIVHPFELDFPHEIPINHFYIGYTEEGGCVEDSGHADIIRYIETVKATHGRPIIGCILGRSGDIQFRAYRRNLTKMLRAFKHKCNYDFVIFLGNDIAPEAFEPCPSNIHFVHYLEEFLSVSITKRLDMLITHSDMNAITNAVLAGTPMLVFPRYNGNDQNGNAARVTYHGLGAQGKLTTDSVQKIMERIDDVLLLPAYRSRVIEMRDRSRASPHASGSNKALGFFIEAADRAPICQSDEVICDPV
jgi:UDP:flavonoid glycosyltransferase YjiC (YdhE family)